MYIGPGWRGLGDPTGHMYAVAVPLYSLPVPGSSVDSCGRCSQNMSAFLVGIFFGAVKDELDAPKAIYPYITLILKSNIDPSI